VTAVSCCVCGSRRRTFAAAHLARCVECGLVYTPAPPEAGYDGGYYETGGYHAYFSRAGQWRYEATRRLRWVAAGHRPRRLLEAGSAGGFFLEAAMRAGIEAEGVELSAASARYARNELGVAVVEASFEEAELRGPFDAVCAFHLLEHVPDPKRFLAKARSVLAAGGRLALEVPNIESAWATRTGVEWPGLQPEYHRWHFSPRTLTRLVTSAGFVLERCDTLFARFYARPLQRLRRLTVLPAVHPALGDNIRLLARCP
jgi:SAM-dependent methyltransferase